MDRRREYENANLLVRDNYRLKHTQQTFSYALSKIEEYKECTSGVEMSVWELAEKMNEIVDDSDPDLHLPQLVHALQTAEAIRQDHPSCEWLILTGFVHDLGKILAHPDFFGEPQWAVVGDTYPVGCPISKKVVYHEYAAENPDTQNDLYNEHKCGIYEPNCGLSNVIMTWGHDEYMYRICIANKCDLPEEALYIIRYHSFYAHHQYTTSSYDHLLSAYDRTMVKWLQVFQKYDLYSKNEDLSEKEIQTYISEKKPYYQRLLSHYFPEKIRL